MNILIIACDLTTGNNLKDILYSLSYTNTNVVVEKEKALEKMSDNRLDLVIVDVTGDDYKAYIELAEQAKYVYRLSFMFLLSHSRKYVMNRIKGLYPKGYLIKPFTTDAVQISMELCLSRMDRENREASSALTESLFLKEENTYQKIPFDDVLWVNAHNRKVIINTKEGNQLEQNNSLEVVYQSLPTHLFFKTHRSYIVNITKIDAINKNFVLIGEHVIPISEIKYKEFISRIHSL